MKKIFLCIIPILLAISGFSQQLQPVKLDSVVSVSLFPGYQRKDTLDQSTYTVNGMYGYMVAIREANAKNNTPLKRARDLNKVLKTYIKGIQAQSPNSVAENVRDTLVGKLKAKVFTLKSDEGGDVTYRNFLLLYTQDVTYTFEYVYPASRADFVKNEYKPFISSIRIAPQLRWNDQYLSNATGISPTTKIEVYGGAGLVVILMIVFIVRRKNRVALS